MPFRHTQRSPKIHVQLDSVNRFSTIVQLSVQLPGGANVHSYTRFLEPTPLTTSNGILIESAVFPQHTLVTNGQANRRTDRQNDDGNLLATNIL